MKKMNNKGFSLVELIVVVLIMAIIAVALAPQVMKWVENSRKSTDSSNYDSIYSAANIALGNEEVLKYLKQGSTFAIKATQTNSGYSYSGTATSGFDAQMTVTLGDGWKTALKVKAAILDYSTPTTQNAGSGAYIITVNNNGTVTRTQSPSNPNN